MKFVLGGAGLLIASVLLYSCIAGTSSVDPTAETFLAGKYPQLKLVHASLMYGGHVYLFSNNLWYYVYTLDGNTPVFRYAKPIEGNWCLPSSWNNVVDSALYDKEKHQVFLFNYGADNYSTTHYVAMDLDGTCPDGTTARHVDKHISPMG